MAFNRKKQLYAPEVEGLIRGLTGFEDNEKNFQEVSRYFYQNIIHHNFATVDFSSVQRSLEGIVEKFKLHGLMSRGKRLQELIERYVASSLSEHCELQWNVLLLLLRLSYRPTSVPEESLTSVKVELKPSVKEEEEEINWTEYLKEGWEEFQCTSEDSDVWSEEEDENYDNEESINVPNDKFHQPVSPLPSYGGVPHPSLWRQQPPPLTQREAIRSIYQDSVKSEQWLKSHVQQSCWADLSNKSVSESEHRVARTCELWQKIKTDKKDLLPCQGKVISEYKVLQEVLWMLQIPTNSNLFNLDDDGHIGVNPNISLSTLIPETLHLYLSTICPYINIVHELKEFQEALNNLEHSDCPAPFTVKAYSSQLSRQLQDFTKTIVVIETRLFKQEETMTLLSVMDELTLELNKLQFLYDIHTRATRGWQTEPPWIQVTRLLSVLYEAFLEANDCKSLEVSLSLFIHSFHIYLDIIDIWLSEGRLEDWRKEFLITKKGDSLEVMPYEQEMFKRGVIPVTLLTKLVKVVKDAGYTLEVVSQLNKLTDLRDNVLNKGCLFKDFLKNVNAELNRLKGMSDQTPLAKEEFITVEDINKKDVQENIRDIVSEENSDLKSAKNDMEIYSLIPAGDATLRGQATIAINEEAKGVINEGSIIPSRHLSIISTETLYDQTMKTFLSNPLLAEALKDYFQVNETPQISPSTPEPDLHFDSITLLGVACMHRVLETQVELVETRHKIASNLVRQALCEEYKLLQHFMVLRNVFFMESGIFAQRFYSYLFKEIELGQWRNRVNLTMHLQNCVKELFPGFHSCFSININRAQSTDKIQQAIQAISIAYTVDWPISLVVTDEAIESYNKVFRFLLHIKYAFWILQDIRFSELTKSPNILRVKRLQALKIWMYHSTNTLHSYFMGLVLRCYSDHLKESVEHASSLADIINAHKKYLVEIKTHCLQLKKSYLDIFIMKLVCQCQDLADLWMLEAAGNLLDSDVKDLEQQYFGAYMGLTDCLEAITEVDDEINPLWELSAEFRNSIPNVYQGGVSAKIN